jgi:hypothetical protein
MYCVVQTGEAIVLAPSGLGVFPEDESTRSRRTQGGPVLELGHFGRRYILMKTRARVTKDGGASVLVIPGQEESEES